MALSICTLENNKVTYNYNFEYNLSEDVIIETITGSKIIVFVDNCESSSDFIKTKYLRFFTGEQLNLEKTSYLIWNLKKFGYPFDLDKILSKLPPTIKYIRLNNNFNNSISELPCGITHIIFGPMYNLHVNNLPFSIEYLYFDESFNQPLDNLSSCLKKLLFTPNSKFNQPLDNLPNLVEYIFLPIGYSNQLDNLPNFLIHIDLYCKYPHCLNNLPNSLKKLTFYEYKNFKSKSTFDKFDLSVNPNNIYSVPLLDKHYNPVINPDSNIKHIDKVFVKLPVGLTYLDLTYSYKLNLISEYAMHDLLDTNSFVKKEKIKQILPLDNLPPNIKVLKFPANYNMIQIDKIPQGVVKLWLSNPFNSSIDKLLNCNFGTNKPKPPTKLTHLVFGREFNQGVNYLPDTVTHLFFGEFFNKSVDNLPNSLVFVKFSNSFNKTVDNLPASITSIEFGKNFSQSINKLPHTVETIKFAHGYIDCKIVPYNIPIKKLPSNLKKIFLKNYNNSYDREENDRIYSNFKELIQYIEYY
jgi:hypothetical protein